MLCCSFNLFLALHDSSLLGSWKLGTAKDICRSTMPALHVADSTGMPGGASTAMPAAFIGQQLLYQPPVV